MKLENIETIENNAQDKPTRKPQKKTGNIKIYRSFLTIVLLLCILQLGYSAILNISKIVIYKGKIYKSVELRNEAKERNGRLNEEIKNYNSSLGQVESIARNNLKMAAEDEVLVIINKNQEEPVEPKTWSEKIISHFKKKADPDR